ncbi:MAG: hypothetical protein ACUVQK_06590 [Thermogutta sp.]
MRWATLTLAVLGALAIGSQAWADQVSVNRSRSKTVVRSADSGHQGAVQLTHYEYPPHGCGWYDGPVVIRPPVPHHPPVVIPFPGHPPVALPYHGYPGSYYGGHSYYRYRSSGHGSVSIYGPRLGFSIGW